jgi:hypothetical protein
MVCPDCGKESNKISTYFERTIQDLSLIDKSLFLSIKLKKFKCLNKQCKRKIFSENIEELAKVRSRRTIRLDKKLTTLALMNTAESASRICKEMNIGISGDTLLRLSKKWLPYIDFEKIKAIGIDDFAFKKNTIMEQ